MIRPTFFHGVLAAAILAFCASAVVATLTPFVGYAFVLRIVIAALGFAYVVYLLGRSPERIGRTATVLSWSALAMVTWWLAPPLPLYLLVHVAAVWLVRCFYFYAGFLPAVLDLGLTAISVSGMVWAMTRSGSIFLATWCFFLVQAIYVAIPPKWNGAARHCGSLETETEKFAAARRRAEQALQQLFSQ